MVSCGRAVKRAQGPLRGLRRPRDEQRIFRRRLTCITFGARTLPYKANIVATNLQKQGGTSTSETVKNAAIGAAAGAVLGAVLSGADKDKILLGGGLGAVAGTAISLGKNGENAVLPAG